MRHTGRPWPGLPWAPLGLPGQVPGPQQGGGGPHSFAPNPRCTALVRASSICLGESEGRAAPHRPPPQALGQVAPVLLLGHCVCGSSERSVCEPPGIIVLKCFSHLFTCSA